MDTWHLTLVTANLKPILPSEASRRLAIHKLAKLAGLEIVLYCVTDKEVHLVPWCDRRRAGRIKQGLARALGSMVANKFMPVVMRQVEKQGTLLWLARRLMKDLIVQGPGVNPALWPGSCFQDLIGARFIKRLQLKFAQQLPRIHSQRLHEMVDLPPQEILPCSRVDVRQAGITRLVEATCSALALGPSLQGRSESVVLARRTIAYIARIAEISPEEIGWGLRASSRAVHDLASRPVAPDVIHAVRMRLALENVVGYQALRVK